MKEIFKADKFEMTLHTAPVNILMERMTLAIPAIIWLVYAMVSMPMMYPGFDVWLHLAAIEFGEVNMRPWHALWQGIFDLFSIQDPFVRGRAIYVTQLIIMVTLLFLAARWLLLLAFSGQLIRTTMLNMGAWLSVLIWMIMHGTVSTAIGNSSPLWQSWLQWYGVNYQLTLPFYIFAVSALLYGLFGNSSDTYRLGRWPYYVLFVTASLGITILHAAEVPYLLFALMLMAAIWFEREWKWHYLLSGLGLVLILVILGTYFSYRLPTGFRTLTNSGLSGFINAIAQSGSSLIEGLNRGNASWNYWYWICLILATSAICILWITRVPINNLRVAVFVLLSAIPAVMLQFKWSAGILAMVTYPELAYRFTFSSFLFVAPAIFLLALGLKYKNLSRIGMQSFMSLVLIVGVLLASRFTETNQVSYKYARSMVFSLNTDRMYYGLTAHQKEWLDGLHLRLLASSPKEPICTDMFTTYYLFFVKGYDNLVLPKRVAVRPPNFKRVENCNFPRDGGEVLQRFGFQPVPWVF